MFFKAGRKTAVLGRAFAALAVAGACAAGPLAASAGADDPNTMPSATYPATYSEQQWITMDDGVKLGATITFPSKDGSTPAPGKFPVVLSMTPYGRDGACGCAPANDFALRGFAVAVVDVRGTGGSQGNLDENYFSPREERDGYDLVEYLGTQPWSTGKVGMSGGSYVGITQFKTAETDPPHLAAIAPDEALADIYNDAYAPGGILSLSFDAQYLAVQGGPGLVTPNTDASMIPGTITAKQQQATGRQVAFDYLENPFDDRFYADRSPITQVGNIKVPVFVEDGWRDAFEAGDIRMFEALAARHGVPTYLNVGPCTHKGCGGPEAPTDNPPNQDNVEAQEIRFDQRYLMGMDVTLPSPVRLYDQQANRYADASSWPPPETSFERQYLDRDAITAARPPASTGSYFTNPAAGFSMSLDEEGTVAASPYVPTDQRLEDGQGLTWRGPSLTQPMTLAGPIALHLVASSSESDTDWFAKVSDVAPDGSESIVSEGQLRASMRALAPGSTPEEPLETLTTRQPLTPGQFYDFEIAIAPTDYTFAPGHRLQLRLTSGNLPNALPGTLTLDEADPAASGFTPIAPGTNTVRFGGADGTSLLLPVYGSASGGTETALRRAAGPVARASVRRVRGSANRFRLSARSSSGRGSRIVSYRWMLGGRLLSRRAVFTHTFAYRAGRPYRLRLIVIAASGRRASTMATLKPRPAKLTPASRHRRR
jgi:putative CocE/NonD family hydrolase